MFSSNIFRRILSLWLKYQTILFHSQSELEKKLSQK